MQFASHIALVTGGGHRLGRAIAWALAARGAAVAVHYHSAAEAAEETVTGCALRLAASGARGPSDRPPAVALQADLTRPEQTDRLFAQIGETYGALDLVVHCVGLHRKTPATLPPERLDAAFEEQLAVNFRAAASVVRRAVPWLRAAGPGRDPNRAGGAVVTLTDALLRRPFPGYGPYHAAKSALEALTRTWAVELAPDIRVNAVAPGIVLPAESDSEASRRRWAERIPLGRLGTPEELAEAVCFLLGATYVTGQVLAVDGGLGWAR